MNLLLKAKEEILRLRRTNEILATKVEVFEKCHSFLTARLPDYGRCMGVDVVWEIDQEINRTEVPGEPYKSSDEANQQVKAGRL